MRRKTVETLLGPAGCCVVCPPKSDVHWDFSQVHPYWTVRTPLRKSNRILAGAMVPALIFVAGAALRPGTAHAGPPDVPPVGKPSPLLRAMKAELDRSSKVYGAQDP